MVKVEEAEWTRERGEGRLSDSALRTVACLLLDIVQAKTPAESTRTEGE